MFDLTSIFDAIGRAVTTVRTLSVVAIVVLVGRYPRPASATGGARSPAK